MAFLLYILARESILTVSYMMQNVSDMQRPILDDGEISNDYQTITPSPVNKQKEKR